MNLGICSLQSISGYSCNHYIIVFKLRSCGHYVFFLYLVVLFFSSMTCVVYLISLWHHFNFPQSLLCSTAPALASLTMQVFLIGFNSLSLFIQGFFVPPTLKRMDVQILLLFVVWCHDSFWFSAGFKFSLSQVRGPASAFMSQISHVPWYTTCVCMPRANWSLITWFCTVYRFPQNSYECIISQHKTILVQSSDTKAVGHYVSLQGIRFLIFLLCRTFIHAVNSSLNNLNLK